MKIRRKKKYIIFVLLLLVCISVGYAVINTTLNINGKSSISKNTWDVYFDNIVVKEDSVEAVKIPTITDKTTVDFEVVLNLPGDFYEFTVDVVNGGTIDGMIDSFSKTPELTTEQKKYINYVIEYQNGEQILSKQLVKSGEFVRIKVRVEYRSDVNSSDLPQSTETLNLGFIVNYVQGDSESFKVLDNGVYNPFKIGNEKCFGTECFYVIGTEGDNVKLLSKYSLYVGGQFDFYTGSYVEYENPTGMQDENMIAILSFEDLYFNFDGVIKFSLNSYWVGVVEEYPEYVYDERSCLYNHIEFYKTKLEEFGVDVIEARPIKYEELADTDTFDCSNENGCSKDYPWIYSTSYWTGTAYSDNSGDFYSIETDGKKGYFQWDAGYDTYLHGVRPVIVVPKSLF